MDDTDDLPETLVPIKATGSFTPLYCIHPISGSAYSYTQLIRLLDHEQPVYVFEAPGFDNDRRPVTSLEEMSSEYTAALREFRRDDPYYLLGWSMGGVVAFDIALRLTRLGAEVPLLILIDAAVPEKADLPVEKDMLHKFMHDLMAAADISEAGLGDIFAEFGDDAEPADLFERIARAGVLPTEVDAEFLQHRYAIFRGHLAALFGYAAGGTYHGPVTVIKAAESPLEYMHWETVASNVENHVLPGDHHSIWTGQGLANLTEIVRRRLTEVQAACPQKGASGD